MVARSERNGPWPREGSDPDDADPPRSKLDLLGVAVLCGFAAWALVAAWTVSGDPWPIVALVAALSVVLVVSMTIASVTRVLVPAFVVIVGVVLAIHSPQQLLSGRPLSGPLGYANAKGALYVQVAVAGVMLALGSRSLLGKSVGLLAAIGSAVVPFASDSTAASVLVVMVSIVGLLSLRRGSVRMIVIGCALLVGVVFAGSVLLGGLYGAGRLGRVEGEAAGSLSQRRLSLWHDAIGIIQDHPIFGVGPGRFHLFSPTSRSHPADDRWAHNEFLQVGAEEGIVGLAFLGAVFIWGFVRLAVGSPAAVRAVGAASLAAVGIHSCVDYVLHFPAIPLIATALIGAAMGPLLPMTRGRRPRAELGEAGGHADELAVEGWTR